MLYALIDKNRQRTRYPFAVLSNKIIYRKNKIVDLSIGAVTDMEVNFHFFFSFDSVQLFDASIIWHF